MQNPSHRPAQSSRHGIAGKTVGTATKRAEWEVDYARFFTFPRSLSSSTAPSSSSSLRPIHPRKKRRLKGTWLRCSSSSIASVYILSPQYHSLLGSTLVVSLGDTIYEEHYVSEQNFTWPQTSGPSDCHIRGSRAIFASYRDSMNQIQKFALRFPSSAEAQTFIESLKWLHEEMNFGRSNDMSSSLLNHRIIEESNYGNPSVEGNLPWQPSIKQEYVHHSFSQQEILNHTSEGIDLALPPSFTALLSDCCTEPEPALTAQPPAELNLSHFLKAGSMADSSFIDMLDKIDSIITFLGGDLAL